MQILPPQAIGRGFVQLPTGAPLETSDQFFDARSQDWVLSSFFTSSGEVNVGRTAYRRPVTLRAKLSVLPLVLGKVWRKKIRPLWAAKT